MDISWHGCKLNCPGWNDPFTKVLAFTIASFKNNEPDIHVIANMSDESLEFELPLFSTNYHWVIYSDTSRDSLEEVIVEGVIRQHQEVLLFYFQKIPMRLILLTKYRNEGKGSFVSK